MHMYLYCCYGFFVDCIVIEAQVPVKEEVERKASIQFPSVTDTSNVSSVFGTMTPMIEIPSVFVLRELEEGIIIYYMYIYVVTN